MKNKNKSKSETVGENQLSFFEKNFDFVRNLFVDFVLYGIRYYIRMHTAVEKKERTGG